jgi:hypothetical protein
MRRDHMPTISFMNVIAGYLNCSIVELIDDKFFIDIPVYNNFEIDTTDFKNYRIYVKDQEFTKIAYKSFFGIYQSTSIKVFSKVELILSDGVFLVYNKNTLTEINILSVGSNLIIALVNNKEMRLTHNEIKVFAQLYKIIKILPDEEYGKLA